MELYGVPGSRVLRSIWAAEEVGIDYERVSTYVVEDSKKSESRAKWLDVARWHGACASRSALSRAQAKTWGRAERPAARRNAARVPRSY